MLHHLLHSVYTVQECFGHEPSYSGTTPCNPQMQPLHKIQQFTDRIPSTNPGAEPPRDAKDSGSARSHSTHLETSSSALQIDLKWSPSWILRRYQAICPLRARDGRYVCQLSRAHRMHNRP